MCRMIDPDKCSARIAFLNCFKLNASVAWLNMYGKSGWAVMSSLYSPGAIVLHTLIGVDSVSIDVIILFYLYTLYYVESNNCFIDVLCGKQYLFYLCIIWKAIYDLKHSMCGNRFLQCCKHTFPIIIKIDTISVM